MVSCGLMRLFVRVSEHYFNLGATGDSYWISSSSSAVYLPEGNFLTLFERAAFWFQSLLVWPLGFVYLPSYNKYKRDVLRDSTGFKYLYPCVVFYLQRWLQRSAPTPVTGSCIRRATGRGPTTPAAAYTPVKAEWYVASVNGIKCTY